MERGGLLARVASMVGRLREVVPPGEWGAVWWCGVVVWCGVVWCGVVRCGVGRIMGTEGKQGRRHGTLRQEKRRERVAPANQV